MIRTLLLTSAISLGMASFAQAQDTYDKNTIQDLMVDILTENPEILITALQTINEQQEQARAELEARERRIREIAANESGAPVFGNPEGDITIVAFTDYNCASCKDANDVINSVVTEDGNIRVVYRDMPVMGENSMYSAKAALAADMQGKYTEFHNALMNLEGEANINSVLRVALDTGVDLNAMAKNIDSEAVGTMIDESLSIYDEFSMEGAPTFFIGTTVASGAPSAAVLREIISQERQK